MSDWLKDIAEMVAQGNTGDSLHEAVSRSLEEIDGEIASLQRQAAAIKSLGHYYAPASVEPPEEPTAGIDTRPDTSTPKKRWRLMHEAALAAAQGKEILDVKDVIAQLRQMGAEFPYSNVGAAVGTVLRDSPEFRRMGGGLWKVVGVQPDPGSEDMVLDQPRK